MQKAVCIHCGYIYDPSQGDSTQDVPPGIPFDNLPDDWRCPICYVGKEEFDII